MILAQTTQSTADTVNAIANMLLQFSGVISGIIALLAAIRAIRATKQVSNQTQTVAQATKVLSQSPATPNLEPGLQSKLDDVASGGHGCSFRCSGCFWLALIERVAEYD